MVVTPTALTAHVWTRKRRRETHRAYRARFSVELLNLETEKIFRNSFMQLASGAKTCDF
jgi:hypothetical protein